MGSAAEPGRPTATNRSQIQTRSCTDKNCGMPGDDHVHRHMLLPGSFLTFEADKACTHPIPGKAVANSSSGQPRQSRRRPASSDCISLSPDRCPTSSRGLDSPAKEKVYPNQVGPDVLREATPFHARRTDKFKRSERID